MLSPNQGNSTSEAGSPLARVAWLLAMCLTLLLALSTFSSYVAALPFIKSEWGISNTTAGLVFSCYLAGYAIAALLVLPLTDRLPTRWVFLTSAVVSVVGNMLFPLVAYDVVMACVLRLAAGVGLVGIYMPGLRIISATFSAANRGAAMGLYVTAFYSANAVSLALTGVLMNSMDWRDAYLVLSALAALSVPLALVLVRDRTAPQSSRSSGRLRLDVLRNRITTAYIIGYSLHAMELYAVRVWLPALLAAILVGRGEDVSTAAITAATIGGIALAAGGLGPVAGGAISDRVGRVKSAAGIFALSGLLCLAIGWMYAAPWPLVVAVSCFLGWAISADSSIYTTAITESAPAGLLGSTMAVQAFLGFMGGVVGPIFIGAVLDLVPDDMQWQVGFTAVALLSIPAVVTLYGVRHQSVSVTS